MLLCRLCSQCEVQGRTLISAYDSGANASAYSDRYFREFPEQFKGLQKHFCGMGAAGGVRKMNVFYLPEARLGIASVTATLHQVPVLPPLGTNLSKCYGNLGRDPTDPYDQFTINFANMRFSLGKLAPKNAHSFGAALRLCLAWQ